MTVLAMNKPAGVVCSRVDQHGGGTVFEFLRPQLTPAQRRRTWHCVGRLDKQTTGLLLFTDEPAFVAHATQPETHLPKTYIADVGGDATQAKLEPLRNGITLHDGPCRPARVEALAARQVRITITEGRNHQVKHMLAAVKLPVLRLHREAIGSLVLPSSLVAGAIVEIDQAMLQAHLNWPTRLLL
ncbi:MAG: rRNA pseudouridine synthase [Myxococcales bacterium]|nr:rRNA pseudouridine synthase [Myxococcales bacterium]